MSISSLLVRGLNRGNWVWNDNTNQLNFVSAIQEKRRERKKEIKKETAINGLTYVALRVDLKFKQTVNEVELMEFRHFLKKKNKERLDSVVTIQDCKIVAIFLCISPLSSLFHKFYNLTSVSQLLRACIVYIQFYLQTCETLVKTQRFLQGSPAGKTSTYQAMKEDLDDLRVLVGRFYAGIVLSELAFKEISKTDEIMLFECFLRVSIIVVWIALERKYLNVIKVELERIFRTAYFNNFEISEGDNFLNLIKKENTIILDGKIADIDRRKSRQPNRLNSCTPVIHNFLQMDNPKLVMIGRKDFKDKCDERLKFLTKYIFVPETEILDEGITLGILGLHRRLFDPLLYPCSKRILKLLISGSPMDITEERMKLRDTATKKAQKDSDAVSPHIFDELPKIPRPNQIPEKIHVKSKVEIDLIDIHELEDYENEDEEDEEEWLEEEHKKESEKDLLKEKEGEKEDDKEKEKGRDYDSEKGKEQDTESLVSKTRAESSYRKILPSESSKAKILPSESSKAKILPSESSKAKILPSESSRAKILPSESSRAKILPSESSKAKLHANESSRGKLHVSESSRGKLHASESMREKETLNEET